MDIEEISEPRRPYHHGNLRETLIDAGTELARTGGPTAVVLRAVSREANVSHNAAYRHFADHEDLLAAVSAQCMRQLGLLMTERMAGITAGSNDTGWPGRSFQLPVGTRSYFCCRPSALFAINLFTGFDPVWFHWPAAAIALLIALRLTLHRSPGN